MRTALVFPGGGMLNAFISGALKGAGLQANQFSSIHANSSASVVAMYFVSGQIDVMEEIWVERLTSDQVFNWNRIWYGRRPANVDYLIDEACHDLDFSAIHAATQTTAVIIGVYQPEDKETVFAKVYQGRIVFSKDDQIRFSCELTPANLASLLKATCAIPTLAKKIELADGRQYVDGGIKYFSPFSEYHLKQDEMDKCVAIWNQPPDYILPEHTIWQSWVAFPDPRLVNARQDVSRRHHQYRRAQRLMKHFANRERLMAIHPDRIWLKGSQILTRDRNLTSQIYQSGIVIGQQNKQVHNFLQPERSI